MYYIVLLTSSLVMNVYAFSCVYLYYSQSYGALAGNKGECHSFSRKGKRPFIPLLSWNLNTFRTHTQMLTLLHTFPSSELFVS